MKEYCLYKHTTPSGKVYIGITSQDPLHRWNNGKGYFNCKNSPFKNSIIKYGWDNITHEILYTGMTEQEAISKEKQYIAYYKNLGVSLNITDGGEGCTGVTPWNKGIKVPYEKSNKRRGCTLTESHKKKLSIAHRGKSSRGSGWKMSEKQKECLRQVNLGRKRPMCERLKISENSPMSKIVQMLDREGEVLAVYKSATEAALALGVDKSWLSKCCRTGKLCRGYKFKYGGVQKEGT
jgi:group I intron endonuclease|nr:MAG TPA: intron associated endonuclease [Crassvirales sp.]